MSEIILKIENLSKQYRLGNVGTGTISHDLNRWWHKIRGKEDPFLKIGEVNDRATKGTSDYVWALKDINFEVRENIFLNGAILGMTKAEINSKIDEIIEFSGCERYINTPVKRYSSGMAVRLAFSVAAHLEPDILVVDEVLAVGDAEFQKKAIGKMQDISKGEGRTVLFVSHNMAAVKSLCTRGIVLENGESVYEGKIDKCISNYLKPKVIYNNGNKIGKFNFENHVDKKYKNYGIIEAELYCDGYLSDIILTGSKFEIKLTFNSYRDFHESEIGIVIKDENNVSYIGLNNKHLGTSLKINKGKGKAVITITDFPIYTNEVFWANLYFGDQGPNYECLINAFSFRVSCNDVYGSGRKLEPSWNRIYSNNIKIYTI